MKNSELAREADGDFGTWDGIWSEMASAQMPYTETAPRTLGQLVHQCYFEDLKSLASHLPKGSQFLEQGAGRGITSMYLAKHGHQVTLVDLSPSGFALAKEGFRRANLPEPKMVVADARDTHLPPTFDCVFSIGLLEHFDDPRPVMAEAFRLLRPGGFVFMVICPKIPESRRFVSDLAFAPWRILPKSWKNSARRVLGRPRSDAMESKDVHRTAVVGDQYATWLKELGAVNVRCVPYISYHDPYLGKKFEQRVVVPLYRLHHVAKKIGGSTPMGRTHQRIALCDLLVGYKPPLATLAA